MTSAHQLINATTPNILFMYRNSFYILSTLLLVVGCQEDFDQRLLRETREYTAHHCPLEMEEGTRLDSLTYDIQKRDYTFWYTLSPLNEEHFYENASMVRPMLVDRVQTDDKAKTIREHEVNFRFVYRSEAHKDSVIYDTRVTPSEYRGGGPR